MGMSSIGLPAVYDRISPPTNELTVAKVTEISCRLQFLSTSPFQYMAGDAPVILKNGARRRMATEDVQTTVK